MLKAWFIGFCLLLCGATFAQDYPDCQIGPCLYYNFMNFERHYEIRQVYHYSLAYNQPPVPDTKLKRDYLYEYIHNGDNLKMVSDIFTNDVRGGKAWLRNLDMGDFAKITFELAPDHRIPHQPMQMSGSLAFFKLFHHRPFGKMKRRLVKE